jgi:hypothetical protein
MPYCPAVHSKIINQARTKEDVSIIVVHDNGRSIKKNEKA